jgi:bifunctional polynucleotide phosphatase/kinase
MESLTSEKTEMIIMVGFPASGKSTFSQRFLIPKGYVHVNRDTLGTQKKCETLAASTLDEGKSVVIDNTNPSRSAREEYIRIATERGKINSIQTFENQQHSNISLFWSKGIPVRCFRFTTPLEVAEHLNQVRMNLSKGKVRVPGIAFNMFKSKFCEPTVAEGFSEIRKINFVRHHPDASHEKEFLSWTE